VGSYCAALAACSSNERLPSLPPASVQAGIADEALAKGPLLYSTDAAYNIVYMIALPSGRLVGKLTGFAEPTGDCVDRNGDVFITDTGHEKIVAFRHGEKQAYKVLPDQGYAPVGCAVDPATGDLAITNCCSDAGSGKGNVAIYGRAKGRAKIYSDPYITQYGFCSYDGHGNLFVDGIAVESAVAELPVRKTRFVDITLNQSLGGTNISGLFWDGDYLAIGSQNSGVIYRFIINGQKGTKIGSVHLNGGKWPGGFWVESVDNVRNVYAPFWSTGSAGVAVYRYPKGGTPTKKLYAVLQPFAVAVSLK